MSMREITPIRRKEELCVRLRPAQSAGKHYQSASSRAVREILTDWGTDVRAATTNITARTTELSEPPSVAQQSHRAS
jgi:hypothetical protein